MKGADHRESSGCPVACSLDLFGDRWSLLIVRDMMFVGKHEYGEFLAMPEGISTNILADRLHRLREGGVIDVVRHPTQGNRKLYFLTPAGKDLLDVMTEIALWGAAHLAHVVDIPPEKRALLGDPVRFKKLVRDGLDEWEKTHLSRY